MPGVPNPHRRLRATTKPGRVSAPGSFRAALREANPDLAAQLDDLAARNKAQHDQAEAEAFEFEPPDGPAGVSAPPPRRRTSDPARRHVTEADVVRQIRDALRARGWEVERTTNGLVTSERADGRTARFSAGVRGRADLYVYPGHGVVAFIEAKRPHGGEVSEVQERWHERMQRRGYSTVIATDAESAIRCVERAISDAGIQCCRVPGPPVAPTAKEAVAADAALRAVLLDPHRRHLARARRFVGCDAIAEVSWPTRTLDGIGFVFALQFGAGVAYCATWEASSR